MGHAVYYHNKDVVTFLDTVHGTANDLLKAVTLDIKEKLYLAGSRALGLIPKLITSPLWRLLEEKGHILDMNKHYYTLVVYLGRGAVDSVVVEKFCRRKETLFDTPVED